MKHFTVLLAFLLLATNLFSQQELGKVTFVLGDAQYSKEGSNQWTKIKINEKIYSDYLVKLIDDAELEIKWSDGEVTSLTSPGIKKATEIRKGNASNDWLGKVKNQIKVIVSNKKEAQAKGVAGVRRDEVNISKQDTSLYWQGIEEADFYEGYNAFENNDTAKAVRILDLYTKQNPTNPNSELAYGCLILIYHQRNDQEKVKEYLDLLKVDFPNSSIIANYEQGQK